MNRPHLFIASLSPLSQDRRVRRQLHFLRDDYRITAAGFTDPAMDGVEFIQIPRPSSQFAHVNKVFRRAASKIAVGTGYLRLLFRQYESYYWKQPWAQSLVESMAKEPVDLIYANEIELLPVAVRVAKQHNAKIFADAHEFTPRQHDHRWSFRFFFQRYWDYVCQKYLPQVDDLVTVSDSIAEEYQRLYGVNCGVITNMPFLEDLEANPPGEEGLIRMIHHGGAVRDRSLEQMIDVMQFLDDRFRLEFMLLPGSRGYLEELKDLASGDERITFREPVPGAEIPSVINNYDLGLYLLQPISSNHRLALPNKLFDFIQGRLAVAIWPSKEMKRVVEHYQCGIVSEEFTIESIAKPLKALRSGELMKMKESADQAARELCAEENGRKLVAAIDGLLAPESIR
ncbi:glycosyltransferase [Akkermansiaceae bacterium]|nr:glycosyltransferase [Akkermansiaceae bacterium]